MVTQVKHQPRKQVIIHEMGNYDTPEQLVELLTAGMPQGSIPPILRWIDGIILTFNALQANTEYIARERTKGILHWDHVSFAPMKTYKHQIVSKNNIVIDVVDVSRNETFQAISKFLKKKIKKK